MIPLETETIFKALRTFEMVWLQGNRLVVWRYGHWHYVTLTVDLSQISAVNFVNEVQAGYSVENMPAGKTFNFVKWTDVSPTFLDELATKVLPDAESYRPLLENGRCRLIIGHTSDTLRELEADIDTLIRPFTKFNYPNYT